MTQLSDGTARLTQIETGPATAINTEMALEASPTSSTQQKEVDYYLNPTELFRWINYRRWDGAKARALSHPDECYTWVVSRHNTDGRVLWRHLPLHLVCMQSENGSNESRNIPGYMQQNRQIAELVDVLLEVHPHGANSPDDQGMLPLHLAINGTTMNERILNLLLMAHPIGIDEKDKFGRTPLDLLKEKGENRPQYENVLRAMKRAKNSTCNLKKILQEENSSHIESVKQSAENERTASRRIIMRLEEELANIRERKDEIETRSHHEEGSSNQLKARIQVLKTEYEREAKIYEEIKRERNELTNQNEILRNQVQKHENIVKSLHQRFEDKNQDKSDTVAKLKSECSTAKAMASALESQLRSRFTNEEYLTNSVMEFETQLTDLKNEYQQEKSKLIHERNAYENENTKLKRTVVEMTKKSSYLQSKLSDVNKEMSTVLASHGALNAEHDRMLDINLRVESELIEGMRVERGNILSSMRKQWKLFENAFKDQELLIEDSQQREVQVLDLAKVEREKTFENIKGMRQDFLDARATALERQRTFPNGKFAQLSLSSGSKKQQRQQHVKSTTSISENGSLGCSSTTSHRRFEGQKKDDSDFSVSNSKSKKKAVSSPKSVFPTSIRIRRELQSMSEEMESCVPNSSHLHDSTKNIRQEMIMSEELDSNFLHLLETRANQGNGVQNERHVDNSSSASVESKTSCHLTSSLCQNEKEFEAINLLNMHKLNLIPSFSLNTGSGFGASSSIHSNTIISKTTTSCAPDVAKTLRKLHNLSLDNFSQSTSTSREESTNDSDSESSVEGDENLSIRGAMKTNTNHFPGMTAGMRMGMIRISEESSRKISKYSIG